MRTRQLNRSAATSVWNALQKRDTSSVKRDRKLLAFLRLLRFLSKSKWMVSIQNEIRTKYRKSCIIWDHQWIQDRVARQDTRTGFPYWSARCPWTPQKRDTRLKNEIGMNFGHTISACHSYVQGLFLRVPRSSLRTMWIYLGWVIPRGGGGFQGAHVNNISFKLKSQD